MWTLSENCWWDEQLRGSGGLPSEKIPGLLRPISPAKVGQALRAGPAPTLASDRAGPASPHGPPVLATIRLVEAGHLQEGGDLGLLESKPSGVWTPSLGPRQ